MEPVERLGKFTLAQMKLNQSFYESSRSLRELHSPVGKAHIPEGPEPKI